MKNFYSLKESLKILGLPRVATSSRLLQRAVEKGKIQATRKNQTKRARLYYSKKDVQHLADRLDRLPRDGVYVGEVAEALGISTQHVLRLRAQGRIKGAVKHPLSGYWVFSQKVVENYIAAVSTKPLIKIQ